MLPRVVRWGAAVGTAVALMAVVVLAAGSAQDSAATPGASPTVPAVVRQVLAADLPATAPGQELQVVRYVIQPGTRLATHVHPGTQLASIEAGTLTYTVLRGEVPVLRAVSSGTPAPVETVGAGQTTELQPGDAVVERPGAVHFGENLDDEPVVIVAATLLTAGEPAAIPVNDLGTPVG